MRFLLINPFYPISETPSPPLGLAFLAAALESAGVEVRILDFVVYPYTRRMLESEITDFKPQMVGATAVTMTFDNAIKVINDVKQINPDIYTVMGGPHVSFCAQETLKEFQSLDFIVIGEGEQTVVDLIHQGNGEHRWNRVNGIAFRHGTDIRFTPPRELIQNLDLLPWPARHLLALGRYRALGMPVSLTTSRGCPFKCIFCVGRKMVGARVRYRSPSKVVEELAYLNTLDFNQINIADDLFTANKKHCLAVCDEIIERNLRLKWTSFARVDTVSEEILIRMKSAGCSAVSFGIESANPGILKTIQKGITLQQVKDAVDMCKRAGIIPHASFILGLPGETPETIRETMDFGEALKEAGLSYGFHLLAPFPGTEVRERSDSFNIRILTNDWSQYHANRAIVETPTVNRQMLDDIIAKWENEYNVYLEDIKSRLETGQATEDESWEVNNLEHIVLAYDLMMNTVIEKVGTWKAAKNPVSKAEALRTLSKRIKQCVAAKPNLVDNMLERTVQQKNLAFVEQDGWIQWRWVDQLH
jgi:radical SAM superfamily enzyme YgiQ (UPF0313 family)